MSEFKERLKRRREHLVSLASNAEEKADVSNNGAVYIVKSIKLEARIKELDLIMGIFNNLEK